jgi:3-deoxy-D-manno-octulosonic-acid transferase
MNFFVYNIIVASLFFIGGPFLFIYFLYKGLLDRHFKERLGLINSLNIPPKGNAKRVLIHAVSVGEVKVASAIIREIKKLGGNFSIILSTTTKTGRQDALRYIPNDVIIIYNPIDMLCCVKRFLHKISPDIFINLETEIWPNFLFVCKKFNVSAFLINGRISEKSMETYRRFNFFIKDALSVYTLLSMISDLDAQRIISIGADPEKVVVGGNAKYDILVDDARPELSKKMSGIYKIDGTKNVFIAGSTTGVEDEIIIKTYGNLLMDDPDMLLVIAPRHIERSRRIGSILMSHKFDYCLRSKFDYHFRGNKQVIIVDVIGELFGLYSLGNIIFCGGSLVPHGGHNILEAAVWGKTVIYGPSMENFLDARRLIEKTGAGLEVKDGDELLKTARWVLENPEKSDRSGKRAREEIKKNIGSAKKQVKRIAPFLYQEGIEKNMRILLNRQYFKVEK